nr:MAG TPA: hypothetical protein [Podoviridae sp. ctgHy19]
MTSRKSTRTTSKPAAGAIAPSLMQLRTGGKAFTGE